MKDPEKVTPAGESYLNPDLSGIHGACFHQMAGFIYAYPVQVGGEGLSRLFSEQFAQVGGT